MSTKGQTYRNDKKTSSKPESRKLAAKDSKIIARQQTQPTTLIGRARLNPGLLTAPDILQLQRTIGNRAVGRLLAGAVNPFGSQKQSVQRRDESHEGNRADLPNNLKAGIESLSGMAMDDVKVQYNSSKPAEVQALAHTQGSNIYVGPGQEKHLPHEAWHVVQQKQGRVKPTDVLTQGAPLNEDPGLEREADLMGAKASQAGFSEHVQRNNLSPVSQSVQREVMQLLKVPTGFGEFETTKFEDADDAQGKGVNIDLTFNPDKPKVDATLIALSQSIRNTTVSGVDYSLGVSKSSRMVASDKSGGGYAIDAPVTTNNPIYYNTKNLGPKEELKDTPMSPPSKDPSDPTKILLNANYQLGYCYKEKPKDKDKKTQLAKLVDKPRSQGKARSQTFETAAFAIAGNDKDKYYGSVKWGYKLEEKDGALKVTSSNITLASPAKGTATEGTPTENFMEAAKLWNAAESQGTLQVAADVKVRKIGSTDIIELTKGTKLKQIGAGLQGESPAIVAEVLNDKGESTGIRVGIKNSDVEDIGGGSANKKLPIPVVKPVAKP